jgi:hypothetical protein
MTQIKEALNESEIRHCEEPQATKQSSSTLRKRCCWIAAAAARLRDDGCNL